MPSKWMVDVKGSSGEAGAKAMQQALQDVDFVGFIEKQGALAARVQNTITSLGYKPTDRGGGAESWHIGVPFDKLDDAFVYTRVMADTFQKAIGYGFLRLELKTWSREAWK